MNNIYGSNWGYTKPKRERYIIPKSYEDEDETGTFQPLPDAPHAQACILTVYPKTDEPTMHILFSYSTAVAVCSGDGEISCAGTYSATTRMHLNKFAKWINRMFNSNVTYYDFKSACLGDYAYNVCTGEVIAFNKHFEPIDHASCYEDVYLRQGGKRYEF